MAHEKVSDKPRFEAVAFEDVTNATNRREIDGSDRIIVQVRDEEGRPMGQTTVTVDEFTSNGGDLTRDKALALAREQYKGIDYSRTMRAKLFA
jgi:hypothetical protein